jgi:hypothetical protein
MSLEFTDEAQVDAFFAAMARELLSECELVVANHREGANGFEKSVCARYGIGLFEECAL